MTSTGAITLTPAVATSPGTSQQQGWRRFWEARDCSPWYLGVSSIVVLLSLVSDLYAAFSEEGLTSRVVGYVSMLVLVAVAFMLQWISTTVAFAVLLPGYVFARGGAEALPLLIFGAVIVGAVVATANARFAVVAALISSGWAIAFPLVAGQSPAVLWFTVLVHFLGISIGLFVRYAWRRREADALKIHEAEARVGAAIRRERKVLARDLHDVVAHNLTIIAMQARTAQFVGTDEAARQAVEVVGDSAKTALVDLRHMLDLLQEDGLVGEQAQPGLAGTESSAAVDLTIGVGRMAHELMELGFTVEHEVRREGRAVALSAQTALYRVLQEATSNIAKHGDRASPVEISVGIEDGDAVLRVVNGILPKARGRRLRRGEQEWNSSGVGLTSMRERASAFGGSLEVGPVGDRWRLVARVPAGHPASL
jgi:signal transduction histidine kinase